MQIDPYAVMASKVGSMHSGDGAVGAWLAAASARVSMAPWPCVRTTGARPGGRCARPGGEASGRHSKTRGCPQCASLAGQDSGTRSGPVARGTGRECVPGLTQFRATGH